MADLHTRFSFSLFISVVIFLSVVDGLADNVARGKGAVQIDMYLSPATFALDGKLATSSCTRDNVESWWAVDLEQAYDISHVTITSPRHKNLLSGLDNIAVGFTSYWPEEGSPVNSSSYTVCGTHNGSVDTGQVITIECAATSQQFRYVIIQSLDTDKEKLCMAEVGVYMTSPRDSEF